MNERIKEFARQAGLTYLYDYSADGHAMVCNVGDIEKFAELIVRECARVYWNIDDGETHTEYVKALKEHFGVEE